jgi:hypothetical protein
MAVLRSLLPPNLKVVFSMAQVLPTELFAKHGFTQTVQYCSYRQYAKQLGVEFGETAQTEKKEGTKEGKRKGSSLILMQK